MKLNKENIAEAVQRITYSEKHSYEKLSVYMTINNNHFFLWNSNGMIMSPLEIPCFIKTF